MENNENQNKGAAVILAGGEGKRLYPLTKNLPKPLVRINGRPVITQILDLLERHGIEYCAITLRYLGGMIREFLGNDYKGMKIEYFTETEPLGTAGSVKSAEKFLSGFDRFTVISGDAYCDFDLCKALSFHDKNNADVTMLLKRSPEPLDYGVVLTDTGGRVNGFIEKPTLSHAFSDLVNTGVYILSTNVLKLIPENSFYDFGRDLFPELCRSGRGIYGIEDPGAWWDIGDLGVLLECSLTIAGGSVIEEGSKIGENAVIRNSIVYSGAAVGGGAYIESSIICGDAVIAENSVVEQYSVVTGSGIMKFGNDGASYENIGKALAVCSKNKRVGVSGKNRKAVIGSAVGYGADVYDLGSLGAAAGYGARKCGLDFGYDSDSDKLYDSTGLPADRITLRAFESAQNEERRKSPGSHVIDKSYISQLYSSRRSSYADWNALAYLIIKARLDNVQLPYYAPDALIDYLRSKGVSAEYYSLFPYDGSEKERRRAASVYEWLVFPETARYHYNLIKDGADTGLPDIYQKTAGLPIEDTANAVRIMSRIGDPDGEGVVIRYKKGKCRILPDDEEYLLFAEADSTEAADEIIELTRSEIRKIEKESAG